MTGPPTFLQLQSMPSHSKVGSPAYQNLYKGLFPNDGLDSNIHQLVKNVWQEGKTFLSRYLVNPDECYNRWKLRDAQSILVQILIVTSEGNLELGNTLSRQLYSILDFLWEQRNNVFTAETILSKFQVCNVLINQSVLSESLSLFKQDPACTLYRNLKCELFHLKPDTSEYKEAAIHVSNQANDAGLRVHNIYSVRRYLESANFTESSTNVKQLYHGTIPCHVLSILNNGLTALVSVMTRFHESIKFKDCALGYGMYFSESVDSCLKYCKPSNLGVGYILVCELALGNVYKTQVPEPSLLSPPSGYESVLGVKSTDELSSFYEENEYVIYNENQVKLLYLVEFSLACDKISLPEVAVHKEIRLNPAPDEEFLNYDYEIKDHLEDHATEIPERCALKQMGNFSHSSSFPMESIHIRARVVDLVAEVTVFQVYTSYQDTNCEVQYTFPLSGGAAVCGFEAFIGSKHVVGKVKKKETAHEEYEEAIREGHGAYLLDEEKPNVFTARLGNLPPHTKAVIKITYVVELSVESDMLKLLIPASFSPQGKGLDTSQSFPREVLSFEACLEMATNIQAVYSPTHQIHVKKTDTKAVLKLASNCTLESGLVVAIRLSEMHIPRMWVERHPYNAQEVCMVSFYPEFDCIDKSDCTEIIFLLDASNSMKGDAFQTALTLTVVCMEHLNSSFKFNIIAFGASFLELFPESRDFSDKTRQQAMDFLVKILPEMGNADLEAPLVNLSMFKRFSPVNVMLISNGQIQDENQLIYFVSNLNDVRLFTLCVNSKANVYFMKRLAMYSGGSSEEYFQEEKGNWKKKVKNQIMKCTQLSLTDIEIDWQQFEPDVSDKVVPPQRNRCLFSGNALIAYGFVGNCNVATLRAKIGNCKFETVVSCSEINKITGTLLQTLAAKSFIDDWESGILADEYVLQAVRREEIREQITALALEYNLVSSLTSFVAVEIRDEEGNSGEPCLNKLLALCSVDILPYVSYDVEEHKCQEENLESIEPSFGQDEILKYKRAKTFLKGNILSSPARIDNAVTFSKKKNKKVLGNFGENKEDCVALASDYLKFDSSLLSNKRMSFNSMAPMELEAQELPPRDTEILCETSDAARKFESCLDVNNVCEFVDTSTSEDSDSGTSDSGVTEEHTEILKRMFLSFSVRLAKGTARVLISKEDGTYTFSPALLTLLLERTESEISTDLKQETALFFTDTFSKLGGGLPVCGSFLKVFQSDLLDELTIDEDLKDLSNLNENCIPSVGNNGLRFLNNLSRFVSKMEDAGLKSMGVLIYYNIRELVALVFSFYYYVMRFLIPSCVSGDALKKGYENFDSVVKCMTTFLISEGTSEIPVEETELRCIYSCLTRINFLNNKYPLIYSVLGLGSSWENAVFDYVQELI